jgi:hypothetical protein
MRTVDAEHNASCHKSIPNALDSWDVLVPPTLMFQIADGLIHPTAHVRTLAVTFVFGIWTPQTEQEVCENIWKVSLAAINQNNAVFPIFSVTRFGNFRSSRISGRTASVQLRGSRCLAVRFRFRICEGSGG